MFGYRKKLARDLSEWQKKGWVEADNAKAILKDIDAQGLGLGLAPILAILAAVLLGFAAMTFVAANWQEMSKLARTSLLFTALGGSYGAAWMFNERGMALFYEAAILLGCAIFGANIMLIAQMYHMEGNPPDAVLMWALGTGLAATLLRAKAALALAIILFTLWSGWESSLTKAVHWPYLIVWAGLLYLAIRLDWRPALHLLCIALFLWVFSELVSVRIRDVWQIILAFGLAVAVVAFFARDFIDTYTGFAASLMKYGLVLAFIGAYGWQFFERIENAELLILATATLGVIIALIFYGARIGDHALLWLGYAGFSIELLSLYFKTLGTLFDTSLFFLVAGLIVSGLAYFAFRLHRAQMAEGEA